MDDELRLHIVWSAGSVMSFDEGQRQAMVEHRSDIYFGDVQHQTAKLKYRAAEGEHSEMLSSA